MRCAYPGGVVGYLGEPSQVAAGGRPLTVAAEVGREGGEGGAVREAARVVFESVGEGAGLGLPGAVGELEAGDQVARAVLRGGGAPLAVELVAEQGFRLVGARAAHGDPARLGELLKHKCTPTTSAHELHTDHAEKANRDMLELARAANQCTAASDNNWEDLCHYA